LIIKGKLLLLLLMIIVLKVTWTPE